MRRDAWKTPLAPALWVCVVLGLVTSASSPAALAAARTYRVTYLTSATVYIDAGHDDGLEAGAVVEVVRADQVIATLRVTDVSSHRAACAIETSTAACAVGDVVRFTPASRGAVDTTGTVAAPPAPIASEPALSWARRMGVRGRVGVRYLSVMDRSGFGGDVSQPSADVRLDGARVGGSPFDLQVDVRARRTVQTVSGGSEVDNGETRVYRLNTTLRSPASHYHLTVGRQFSSALASISTFDGAEVELERMRFGVGVFGGTQPAPLDYGFSTDVTEYGVFVRWRAAPPSRVRWEGVVAGIGSYQDGHINREYVSLVGGAASPRVSLMLTQDVDVNRGWKRDAGESQVSFTNTFVSARYRVARAVDFDAGYDNRRDVRLYRDFVSPETQFDDSYRQGIWGGAGVGFAERYRVGATARSSRGGAAGDARSVTLTGSAARLTAAQLELRIRSTYYENEFTTGWMNSLSSGFSVSGRWMLELYGGLRSEEPRRGAVPGVDTSWFGADVDLDLGHGLYGSVTGERNEGYDQVYSSLSWRF